VCQTLVLLEVGSRITCCELLDGDARTRYDVAPTPAQGVQRLIAIGASTTQGYPPNP
jgi:hypothetical protein